MNIIPHKLHNQEPARTSGQPLSLERLFESFFDDGWSVSPGALAVVPALDMVEGEKEITVRAEIPGLDPQDIDIQVSGDVLSIAGEKKQQVQESRESWYHAERRFGQFRRVVRLPAAVDADKVSADYDNGVLVVHLPLSAESRPRRIEVRKPS
jgi:HSP20 family protein